MLMSLFQLMELVGKAKTMLNKIAIIPARSGSKGLKDKNIADLCGKQLIAYTISAAIDSRSFEKVIVTTDSQKYADISEKLGASIMMRGENISNDKATSFMVINDVLCRLSSKPDYFVLLQPTSPLRTESHIREALTLFEKNYQKFDFLVSMKKADIVADLVKPIDDDLSLKNFDSDFSNYHRQTYNDYSPNGAIFIGKPDAYLKQKHFFGPKSIAYFMDKESSVDIDDYTDLLLAECIIKKGRGF